MSVNRYSVFAIIIVIALPTTFLTINFIGSLGLDEGAIVLGSPLGEGVSNSSLFPYSHLENISSWSLIEGNVLGSDDIFELSVLDNDYFDIISEGFVGNWEMNIEFSFSAYPKNTYLFIDLEASGLGTLLFQSYTFNYLSRTFDWETIFEINEAAIHLEKVSVENSSKFRLLSDPFTVGQKTVSIDRMQLFFRNDIGGISEPYSTQTDVLNVIYDENDYGVGADGTGQTSITDGHSQPWGAGVKSVPTDWWREGGTSLTWNVYVQKWWDNLANGYENYGPGYAQWASGNLYCSIDLDEIDGEGIDTNIEDVKSLNVAGSWHTEMGGNTDANTHPYGAPAVDGIPSNEWNPGTNTGSTYIYFYIFDLIDSEWKIITSVTTSGYTGTTSGSFNIDLASLPLVKNNMYRYYDPIERNINLRLAMGVTGFIVPSSPVLGRFTGLKMSLQLGQCDAIISSAPSINLYTLPDDPINSLEEFAIIADSSIIIPNSECMISNSTWNSEWMSMNNLAVAYGSKWRYVVPENALENGNYTLWVNTTDIYGGHTYTCGGIEIGNQRPTINIINPLQYSDVYDLFNYDIQAEITDFEGDAIESAELRISNSTDSVVLDWTNMTDIGGDIWNLTIDPFDYGAGLFNLTIRAKDTIGHGYNSTFAYFRNDPIEIDMPSSYSISDYLLFNAGINVTQGIFSIDNFTYSVKSLPESIDAYYTGYKDADSGITEYSLSINPLDLPSGDLFFELIATNYTGAQFKYYKPLYVDYYYDMGYIFQNVLDYQSDYINTNSYVRGSVQVDYDAPLSYNYRYTLTSFITSRVYSKNPEYKILRPSRIYYPQTSEVGLAFKFSEQPTNNSDKLSFNIATPALGLADVLKQSETGVLADGRDYISIELLLTSSLDYSNIKCSYAPFIALKDATLYNYSIYLYQGGVWAKSNISVIYSGDYFEGSWDFNFTGIKKDEQIGILIYGIKTVGDDINIAPIMYGGIIAAAVGIVWFALLRKPMLKKKAFKKRGWLYYTIGAVLCGGLFMAVFLGTSMSGGMLASFVF